MTFVTFTTDKNGRPIAYVRRPACIRYFRIGMAEAEILVATGQAVKEPWQGTFLSPRRPAK